MNATAFRLMIARVVVRLTLLWLTGNAAGNAQPWVFSKIHVFERSPTDGSAPNALVQSGGNLYGSTQFGGASQAGTVFSLTPPATDGDPWTETVLYSFSAEDDGIEPYSLTVGPDGALYGYAERFNAADQGVIFSLSPPAQAGAGWTYKHIHDFLTHTFLDVPLGVIAIDKGGILYGVTYAGDVFSLAPTVTLEDPWTYRVIYQFVGSNGYSPTGGLSIDSAGVLYGGDETETNGAGVTFSLSPPAVPGGPWIYTALYQFSGGNDGSTSLAPPAINSAGVLYGAGRGVPDDVVVYSLTPPATPGESWTKATLFTFPESVSVDAPSPESLVVGPGGTLYGSTTGPGGKTNNGEVFSLTPPQSPGLGWTGAVLHTFRPGLDGSSPGNLIVYNGVIYGPAYAEGESPGYIFQLEP